MTKPGVAAERKGQIVHATVECIAKLGYHNFSMQDVAKTAGLSKGIIHYYFLSKDDLMMAVLEKVAGNIEAGMAAKMQAAADPIEKLKIFIKACFEVIRNTKEYYQVNMDFWTQINQKDEVRSAIAAHYGQFRDTACLVINEGIHAGKFRQVDAKHYGSMIIALVDGLSLQWLFDNQVFDYDKITQQATAMIVDGLLKV